jgi:DNA replication and repair protein RecF
LFVKRIYAKNFRSFDEVTFDFVDGVNFVVGDNGVGKTTLLEALFFCITGSSFRSQQLKELIQFDTVGFFVEVLFEKQEVTHSLHIAYDGKVRRVNFNHAPCISPSELLGKLMGVASTPEDIELVHGAPSVRRRYLDLLLAQIDPHYVYHLRRYTRAIKQRNILLKQRKESLLFCWEQELASSGAYITTTRKKAMLELMPKIYSACRIFFQEGESPIELIYTPQYKDLQTCDEFEAYFVQEYARKRAQELELGASLTGPHRDDIDIRFYQKSAADFASIGQARLIAQGLRLASWYFLKERTDVTPLMIVDDFATSLDDTKKVYLAEELSKLGQVFLSSTHELPTKLAQKSQSTQFIRQKAASNV